VSSSSAMPPDRPPKNTGSNDSAARTKPKTSKRLATSPKRMRWVGVMGGVLMLGDARWTWRKIVDLAQLGARCHHVERLGGFGETSAKQQAGDNSEEEVFECLHRRPLSPTL
jgi:hypothetical protein